MAQAKRAPARRATRRKAKVDTRPWALWAAAMIVAVTALRLAVNWFGLAPVHFDEARYWAYGQELAWGYFSEPPLVGWLTALATWWGGPTSFWLRAFAVVSHAVVASVLFLLGRRLWDGRTGFWAAAGYTAAPGVTVSAMLMTADPVLMALWAVALYAWFRAAEGTAKSRGRAWWAALGAALGLSILASYIGIAFAAGALGYGLLSARGRDWAGTGIAAGVALLIVSPNLAWLAASEFATIGNIAADAAPPGERYDLGALAAFLGAQLGMIGPAWFIAILAALWWRRDWRDDSRMRMLAWQCFALLIAMALLAFWTGARPNWAAPAYVAGSLLAARIVLAHGWRWALSAQTAVGIVAAMALYGAAFAYASLGPQLPRVTDPFKHARTAEPFCAIALGHAAEEGTEVLLSDNRHRLSECMFLGGLTWDNIAIWNPGLTPRSHHELISTLRPGDQRPMILATTSLERARRIARHFETARRIETGRVPTHADRSFDYSIWAVQGFEGY